jgi:hypothetical protein
MRLVRSCHGPVRSFADPVERIDMALVLRMHVGRLGRRVGAEVPGSTARILSAVLRPRPVELLDREDVQVSSGTPYNPDQGGE